MKLVTRDITGDSDVTGDSSVTGDSDVTGDSGPPSPQVLGTLVSPFDSTRKKNDTIHNVVTRNGYD